MQFNDPPPPPPPSVSISPNTNLSSSASLASSCSILCNLSLSTRIFFSSRCRYDTRTVFVQSPPSGITDVGRESDDMATVVAGLISPACIPTASSPPISGDTAPLRDGPGPAGSDHWCWGHWNLLIFVSLFDGCPAELWKGGDCERGDVVSVPGLHMEAMSRISVHHPDRRR